ncbi:hypothetical protein G7046_g4246 [Stylonectria norvegica]|nr:hypothetical protein G7046_g4246 [Stylonectria norvegica]
MADRKMVTLCLLGCGNLGTAILNSLLTSSENELSPLPFTRIIACVRSQKSLDGLRQQFPESSHKLSIQRGDNVKAVEESDVIILGVDPADVSAALTQPRLSDALADKLLISIVVGWTRQKLETTLYGDETTRHNAKSRARIIRTLPNIGARVSQGLTTIEVSSDNSEPQMPEHLLALTNALFEKVGKVVQIPPRLMSATTAVASSTPAFFAVICDAMIDAAVAVGVPRDMAQTMIYQSMQGTATLLQSGVHPGILKDQGTSPEGCTIGGLMVLEEGAVRGHIGRALRESVTIARLMENVPHVNDTRQ